MRQSDSICANKRTPNEFQASLFQKIPAEKCSTANALLCSPICASFKMSAGWKNVSIEPGGVLDFSEEAISNADTIQRIAAGQYLLSRPGAYLAQVQIAFVQAAQVIFSIDGEERLDSVLGTSGEGGSIRGFCAFETEKANTVLSICNPSQSVRPIVVSLYTGGTLPVTSDLMIVRMR